MPSAPGGDRPYPSVEPQPHFPAIEEEVLAYWAEDGTFQASVEARPGGDNEYVFYDGPPFANGLPHYGHLLTGFVKDAVPRYQTMRGRRVERRFGWDCHGLPAEMEAERELGVTGRADITAYGIGRFNDHCRASVLRYTHEWERYVTRQARWVDFDHDYKTLDLDYMESVLWAFKELHARGLVHEGHRVLPYCWECETPLSNFETRMDDAYRERQDPAITVRFLLEPAPGETGPTYLLAWTTTPWTLPSNLVVAVGADIDYAVFEEADGARYVLAASRVDAYASTLADARRVATVKGAELVDRRFRPLFDFFAGHPGAFRVLAADFVTTEEGTGIVQVAPGFGEDDQRLCDEHGIALVAPVDDRGRFTAEVPPYEGLQVFEANNAVIADLKATGALVRRDSYVHSYPHCWRSDTPLIYRAMSSWFVGVTAFRDRMVELNRQIRWVPPWVGDSAFARWLEHARDWSISRNRFWGTPIPVWKSDDPAFPRVDVYGSLDELERDFGVRPTDLHRPAIDALTRPNPDDPSGNATMRRVEDVLDCWFESGSMPYAQVHYPFENRDWFESHFPADFIVEYVGQTRGWFYTLHVLATALFDKPPFRTCLAHGVVLGDDGQKASKRLRNYPDPDEVFSSLGADAMRWSLLSSPVLRGGDLVVDRRLIVEAQRAVLAPLWNAWTFFTRFANAEGHRARMRTDAAGLLDRYALAKASELVAAVTTAMDGDDLSGACAAVEAFLDALCNWYIRRSRPRFWGTGPDGADTDAFDTLATVLEALCRTAAPLLPMVTESIWRGLRPDGRSVHLCDWPAAEELPADPSLVADMDRVREVCSVAHSVREVAGRHVRLPLAALTVAAPGAAGLAPYVDLIAAEVNVKAVHLTDEVGDAARLVLSVNPRVAGPRLGPDVQKVIMAVRAGDWDRRPDGTVVAAGIDLQEGEFELRLKAVDPASTGALSGDAGVVVLDTTVTPELAAEGLARDVTRLVQRARKDAGLEVTDRIRLVLDIHAEEVRAAVQAHQDWLAEQTLAVEVDYGRLARGHRGELPDGRAIHIGVTRMDTAASA